MTRGALRVLIVALGIAASTSASARDLWVVAQGRVLRVDTLTGIVRHLDLAQPVHGIAPTPDGGAWILRERTLARVDEAMIERANIELADADVATAGPMAADPHGGTLWMAFGGRLAHFDLNGNRLLETTLPEPLRALAVVGPEAAFAATASSLVRFDSGGNVVARVDLAHAPGGDVSGMAIDPLAGFLWLARAGALVRFDILAGLALRASVPIAVPRAVAADVATGEITVVAGREVVRFARDGTRLGPGVVLPDEVDEVAGIERGPSAAWLWLGDRRGVRLVDLAGGGVLRVPGTDVVTRFETAPPRFESHLDAVASVATGTVSGTDVALRYFVTCDGAWCAPASAFLRALSLGARLGGGDIGTDFARNEAGDVFTATLPYSPWEPGPTLAASTRDAYGNRSDSASIAWPLAFVEAPAEVAPKAGSPPTIAITAPLNSATYTAPLSTTITAAATPGTGATITKVEFFAGATLIGTVTTAPYSVAWTNVQVGTYPLTAKVTDSANATATSAVVTVTVSAGALAKPIDAWLFNDAWTSATPIADAAGTHDGVAAGTLASVTANASAPKPATCKAASFTGSGGVIDIAGLAVSVTASARTTVAFWMYWNGIDDMMPISWATQGLVLSGGSFGFTTHNGDVFGVASTGFANKWLHVIAEFVNGGVAANKLYLNGVPQTLTQRVGTPVAANAVVAPTLRLAGRYSTATLRFVGQLDEVKIFNRALTPSEASAEFAAANACDNTPTVAMTSPANNSTFVAPASIAVTATAAATSSAATLTKVDFYNGTTLLATRVAAPFTYTWSSVPVGTYRLTAKATDSKGSRSTTAAATVTVNANVAPSVTLTAPAANSVFTAPATIVLTASASDPDGTVAKVEFYQGTTRLATLTAPPYTYTWSNVAGGTYSLTAKATDNLGAVKTSAAVPVVVNRLPTVSITSPVNNASIVGPANVTITASASDPDGSIVKVEFYRDGALVATDTTSPYSYVWYAPWGTYVLTAKATDNRGAVATSAAVTVNVKANQAPTIAITSPVAGTRVPQLSAFPMTATAADADGSISKVEFYWNLPGNAIFIGRDTTAPYSIMVPPFAEPGAYSLTAWAFDSYGVITVSAPVEVVRSELPIVYFTQPQQWEYDAPTALPDVTIAVDAFDTDGGTIRSVRIYKRSDQADGGTGAGGDAMPVLLGTFTAPPYEVTWKSVPHTDPSGPGIAWHSVWAEATDDSGDTVSSGEQTLLVWQTAQPSTATFDIVTPDSQTPRVFDAPASIVLVGVGSGVASVEWLANGSPIGSTPAANGTTGEFAFAWRNVPAGTYAVTARFTDGLGRTGTTATATTITVRALPAPVVTLTSPTSASVVPTSADLAVAATVTNLPAGGTVLFTENYNYLANDSSAPFGTTVPAIQKGIHVITAQAYVGPRPVGDPARAYVSAPVVTRAPVGVITSPSPTGSYTSATPITVTVDAKALDGTIGRVDIYSGSGVVASITSPPYSYTTTWPLGTHTVYAAVNVAFGPRTFTTPVTFTVGSAAPDVSIAIASPVAGQRIALPYTLPLTVNVTDPNRKVTRVTYWWTANVNGGQIASATTPPYSATWDLPGIWEYVLVANAHTASGIVASAPVIFYGVSNLPPTVRITSPLTGQSFFVGQPIPFTVDAADSDGTITKVEYFTSTGTSLGTATAAPFAFTWSPAVAGTYSIYARATDDRGAATQSASVDSLVVAANAVPTVALVAPQGGSAFAAGGTINLAATAADADGGIARVDFHAGSTLVGSATTAPYIVAWSNVAAGTYALTARAVDNRGAVTTSAPVSVTVQPLALTIASPAEGASIAADFVTVTGTFQAPPNSGVTVNGVVANSDGSNYFINGLALVPGTNTITVTLTTAEGQTVSQSRMVMSTAAANYRISASIDNVMAPGSVLLRVAKRLDRRVVSLQIANLGGTADLSVFDGATLAKVTFTNPGRYEPIVTIQDDAGNSYSQSVAILVQDPVTLSAVVRAVWTGFAGSLAGGDKLAAMSRMSETVRFRYGPTLDALAPYFAQIIPTWSAPSVGLLASGLAELVVTRDVQGVGRMFFVYVIRERDGVWRLTSM